MQIPRKEFPKFRRLLDEIKRVTTFQKLWELALRGENQTKRELWGLLRKQKRL